MEMPKIQTEDIISEAQDQYRERLVSDIRARACQKARELFKDGFHEISDSGQIWSDDPEVLAATIFLQECLRVQGISREQFDGMDHANRMAAAKSNTLII